QDLGNAAVEIDLDRSEYLGPRDMVDYVKRRLLATGPSNCCTHYRDRPELAEQVAEAVARRADRVFLIARIVSDNPVAADEPVDVQVPGWENQFASAIGDAFQDFLNRFDRVRPGGLDKRKVIALLKPLAYSEGEGLP